MSKLTKFKRNGRRLLTLGLAPVIAITISSCSSKEIGPVDNSANYLTVGNYSVTNGEVWDNLKWSAANLFGDFKEQVVLQPQIEDIKTVLADKNNANYNYYTERLQNYIIEDVYDFDFSLEDHEEEIEDLLETTKKQDIIKYADTIYVNYRVNISTDDIISALENGNYAALEPLYEIYYNDFASELYAREKLQEEIDKQNEEAKNDDDDSTVGYFTKTEVINRYKDYYLNQGDVNLIMIKFASEDEMNNTLRAFGIKVDDDQFYYLTDTPTSYNEYISYYEDFDFDTASPNEYFNLDASYGHSIILQLYIAMYNYIYTYRDAIPNLKAEASDNSAATYFSNANVIDQRSTMQSIIDYYDENNLVTDAKTDEERVTSIINEAKTAVDSKYIVYTAEELNDLDSSLYTYVYETLKEPQQVVSGDEYDRYSTPSNVYSSDNYQYMIFKYQQETTDDDKLYNEDLTDDELYDAILENTTLYDKIVKDLTDEDLTSTYITNQLTEATNEVEVKIYDSSIEISYSVNNSNYSKTLSSAPDSNTVASFSYDGRTVNAYVTTEDGKGLWDILEYRNGITAAANILSNKMMKDTEEYKNIPQDIVDNFYSTIEYVLASFANDALASNGYPASIGKYNFLMLYYHTADIDEIVNDVYKVSYVSQQILTDYSSESVVNFFEEFSTKAYNNYFNITAQKLSVYLDIDEDGTPDDIANWKDLTTDFNGQTMTYADIAKELIKKVYSLLEVSTSAHTDALKTIVDNYNASSRFNSHEGGQFSDEDNYYDPIGNEWDFSQFKKLGFAIATEEVTVTNSTTDVDLAIKNGLYDIYKSEGFEMEDTFPNSYLPSVENSVVEAEDAYNYFVITAASGPSSAKYEESSDEYGLFKDLYYMYNEKVVTIDNVYNDTDVLNFNQIKAYLLEYINSSTSNLLPSDISDSLTNYLSPVLTRFKADGTQFEIVLKYIAGGDTTKLDFANDENDNRLPIILEINQRAADDYTYYGKEVYNNFSGWWDSLDALFTTGGNN